MKNTGITAAFIVLITAVIFLGIRLYLAERQVSGEDIFSAEAGGFLFDESPSGPYMYARNLNFRFTDKIVISIPELWGRMVSQSSSLVINMDDVNSFKITILGGRVIFDERMMLVLFRDYVFNYDGSPLRLSGVRITGSDPAKGEVSIMITGAIKLFTWLDFKTLASVYADNKTGRIIIETKKIKIMWGPWAKTRERSAGLTVEKMLPVPAGRGVTVKGNKIFLMPFEILPSPKFEGTLQEVSLCQGGMLLRFSGEGFELPQSGIPRPKEKNYRYLFNGRIRFGKLTMADASMQIADADPADIFDFSLKDYHRALSGGGIALIRKDRSVLVVMPDYNDVVKTRR